MKTALPLVALVLACAPHEPAPSEARGVVSGLVEDALGEPLPGADVRLVDRDERTIASARTGADGTFRIDGIPTSHEHLAVFATAAEHCGAGASVRLSGDPPHDEARVRLYGGGTIRGRVVGETGAPLAGSHVMASFDAAARALQLHSAPETVTDADGRYELTNVPLGDVVVRALQPGLGYGHAAVWLRDEAEVDLVVEYRGVDLTVRVEGVEPSERADVSVRLLPYVDGAYRSLPRAATSGTLGADGSFSVSGLLPCDYEVRVAHPELDFEPRSRAFWSGGLLEKETTLRAVRPAPVRVAGTLRDRAGRPLAGETLVFGSPRGRGRASAATDADGAFELESALPHGSAFVLALEGSAHVLAPEPSDDREPSISPRYRGTVAAVLELDLVAVPATRVTGRVLAPSGAPARGVTVELEHGRTSWARGWRSFERTETDAGGAFAFEDLIASEIPVRVHVSGRVGAGSSDALRLAEGEDVDAGTIRLVAPATVEGSVRDASGEPIPGARVWLRAWDFDAQKESDGNVEEVLADRGGRFRHLGVAPGGYYLVLLVEGDDAVAETEPFAVESGATESVELVAP